MNRSFIATVSLLCAASLGWAQASSARYALYDLTMSGQKGKVRTVQIQESRSESECQASFEGFHRMERPPNAEGPPKIACLSTLPSELAAIHVRGHVPQAFHVEIESGRFQRLIAGELVTHNLFFYSMDPGTPADVCARLTESMKSFWHEVRCTAPTARWVPNQPSK